MLCGNTARVLAPAADWGGIEHVACEMTKPGWGEIVACLMAWINGGELVDVSCVGCAMWVGGYVACGVSPSSWVQLLHMGCACRGVRGGGDGRPLLQLACYASAGGMVPCRCERSAVWCVLYCVK